MLLIVNVLAGFMFNGYEWTNVSYSSIVLIVNLVFIILLQTVNLKDAFKIALSVFLPITGIIEFVLALLAPIDGTYWAYCFPNSNIFDYKCSI